MAISTIRTKGSSADAMVEFAESKGVKIEWIVRSYEYNLSRMTLKTCNKEMAEVIMKRI